jgi:hypothetical protein
MHKITPLWPSKLGAVARCVVLLQLAGKPAALAIWFIAIAAVGIFGSHAAVWALAALAVGGVLALRAI